MGALGWSVLVVILLASDAAAAEPPALGARRQIVVSGERLFGVDRFSATVPGPEGQQTTTATTFSLLSGQWFRPTGGGGLDLVTFSFPRLALDVFAAPRLSLGAAASYFQTSTSFRNFGDGSASGFLLSPRIGYVVAINRAISFWPRAGISVLHASEQVAGAQRIAATLIDATLEAPVAFTVFRHVAFTIGPTLDLGVFGRMSQIDDPVGQTASARLTEIGLQVGVMGIL